MRLFVFGLGYSALAYVRTARANAERDGTERHRANRDCRPALGSGGNGHDAIADLGLYPVQKAHDGLFPGGISPHRGGAAA